MVSKLDPATRLAVAERCCAYYIEIGSTQATVSEIAAAAGVADRTFYRYFPTKAESVAPVFDSMTAAMNAHMRAGSETDVRARVVGAFDSMFQGAATGRAAELFPLILRDPEMWALFLRKVHDGETSLAPLLASAIGIPAESDRARVAAAAVASAVRIALERLGVEGTDLRVEFLRLLDAFGPALLQAEPESGPVAST